jgi:hypothetical protein
MIRMLWMSLRLGMSGVTFSLRPSQPHEAVEEVARCRGARGCIGVPLEAEARPVRAGQALDRASRTATRASRAGCQGSEAGSTAKPWFWLVISTCCVSRSFDRVVRAMVAELHLDRARSRGEAHDLVAQADAEGRHASVDQLARRGDRVAAGLGSPGPLDRQDARPGSASASPALAWAACTSRKCSRDRPAGAGCCARRPLDEGDHIVARASSWREALPRRHEPSVQG